MTPTGLTSSDPEVPDDDLCAAWTADEERCRRLRAEGDVFCQQHSGEAMCVAWTTRNRPCRRLPIQGEAYCTYHAPAGVLPGGVADDEIRMSLRLRTLRHHYWQEKAWDLVAHGRTYTEISRELTYDDGRTVYANATSVRRAVESAWSRRRRLGPR